MGEVQAANWSFFLPLIAAYLAASAGWLLVARIKPFFAVAAKVPDFQKNFKDLGFAILAIIGIFLLGQAYRMELLLPTSGESWFYRAFWIIDNLIIYSPIFIVLLLRKHPLSTVFLSPTGLWKKLITGAGLGVLSVIVFLLLRGELARIPDIAAGAVEAERLVSFVPVFLEGVAVAFLFVRLKWAFGLVTALVVPPVLFALAHVPGQIATGMSVMGMISFFFVNSGLVAAILYVVQRSRDVIWIGLVHYLMDIAIEAI